MHTPLSEGPSPSIGEDVVQRRAYQTATPAHSLPRKESVLNPPNLLHKKSERKTRTRRTCPQKCRTRHVPSKGRLASTALLKHAGHSTSPREADSPSRRACVEATPTHLPQQSRATHEETATALHARSRYHSYSFCCTRNLQSRRLTNRSSRWFISAVVNPPAFA